MFCAVLLRRGGDIETSEERERRKPLETTREKHIEICRAVFRECLGSVEYFNQLDGSEMGLTYSDNTDKRREKHLDRKTKDCRGDNVMKKP